MQLAIPRVRVLRWPVPGALLLALPVAIIIGLVGYLVYQRMSPGPAAGPQTTARVTRGTIASIVNASKLGSLP